MLLSYAKQMLETVPHRYDDSCKPALYHLYWQHIEVSNIALVIEAVMWQGQYLPFTLKHLHYRLMVSLFRHC